MVWNNSNLTFLRPSSWNTLLLYLPVHICTISVIGDRGLNPSLHKKKSHTQYCYLIQSLLYFSFFFWTQQYNQKLIKSKHSPLFIKLSDTTWNFQNLLWMALLLFPPQKFAKQSSWYCVWQEVKICQDGLPSSGTLLIPSFTKVG
jgi:hypothetical protein